MKLSPEVEQLIEQAARKLKMYSLPENCVKPQRRKAAVSCLNEAEEVARALAFDLVELAAKKVCKHCADGVEVDGQYHDHLFFVDDDRGVVLITCAASSLRDLLSFCGASHRSHGRELQKLTE
jgi:hypothetical protein